MGDIAIRVENLGKLYHLGRSRMKYRTMRDSIVDAFSGQLKRFRGQPSMGDATILWALRDISFEVRQGEVMGIIGRNGAGKSTLLKVLSQITEPTEGRVEVHGRVGSLLEVGTGFHPELTGRENIYLNGAILGMRRRDITRKFDEIVDFAEMERFVDTPIKRYSSGMYVRLAFAVAAHLEPDILIVDEVLAVGDIGFQKKCLNKMGDVSKEGRTVLLVSHNMLAIRSLCDTALLLNSGQLTHSGKAGSVISAYEETINSKLALSPRRVLREGDSQRPCTIEWVELRSTPGEFCTSFEKDDSIVLSISLRGIMPEGAYVEWSIYSEVRHRVSSGGTFMKSHFRFDPAGRILVCRIGPLCLAVGKYVISLKTGILPGTVLDEWSDAVAFTVDRCDADGEGFHFDSRRGDVLIPATYQFVDEPVHA